MKARRFLFRAPTIFGTPLKYGAPVFIGFTVIVSGLSDAHGGDILRGGSASSRAKPGRAAAAADTPDATDAARANAKDTLARTTRTLDAMRAMQNAARNAALANSTNHLTVNLPAVPNGLGAGALNPTANPAKWTGANAPLQTVKNGKTTVTIKQTTQQALLEWQTLNVGKKTTLTFDQSKGGESASQWIAFNKITDPSGNPTQILGNIKADGQVYLINPNGIIFGGGSQVNARGLTASSLPINENLIANGLLNNPNREFLFDGLGKGKSGDVTVQAGAKITSPVSADGNGGRVMLVGANVTNEGTISTPAGQTILAAGLQVAIAAHPGSDPGLRGLDTYVGAIVDPSVSGEPYAGAATNSGLIEAARANVTLTGKEVNQLGVIESTTSVSLNGRIDLLANYGAAANAKYNADGTQGNPFLYQSTGSVTLGNGSLTRILPEYGSKDKVVGTELALRSQINLQGRTIHLDENSTIFAPNAKVSLQAGKWAGISTSPFSTFIADGGQVYLDNGATVDLAGTTGANASVLQNYVTLVLRGSEFAVAPLQRDGKLRGDEITVDITKTGTYSGRDWVGTPLADVTGFVGLIERDIAQLTTAGGTLDISAGGSVVIRKDAKIDVSGGWTNFSGDVVGTTQLWSGGKLIDIADATPDRVYDGIFTGSTTVVHEKWGVTETFDQPLAPTGKHYEAGYKQGADAGGISISAPSLALDGSMLGVSVVGPKQARSTPVSTNLPATGSLTLKVQAQVLSGSTILTWYPENPTVIFTNDVSQQDAAPFSVGGDGEPVALETSRRETIKLSPELFSSKGFGRLTVENAEGDILLPGDVALTRKIGGSLTLKAANIDIHGGITAPGGSLVFTAYNISPYAAALLTSESQVPAPVIGKGVFNLGADSKISTAGLITGDFRSLPGVGPSPLGLNGGSVSISGYNVDLLTGSLIDVSGGYVMTSAAAGVFGNGGSITVKAGQDPNVQPVLGGSLKLGAILQGYSGKSGGSLSLQAPHVQLGGSSTGADTLVLQSGFFNQGGFKAFNISGLGGGWAPAVLVTSGAVVAPVVKGYRAEHDAVGRPVLEIVTNAIGVRQPVTLDLAAPGVRDLSGGSLFMRGDVVVDDGSVLRTDPGGSVSVAGNTVSILGSIIAPGGTINVAGGSSTSTVFSDSTQALVTTYLGSNAVLSATGATVLLPDDYKRRIGTVLAGGTITLGGNIAATEGAILDVSGTSGILDLDPAAAVPVRGVIVPTNSGVTGPVDSLVTVPTRIDSNGGDIILKGGQMLFSDAVLLANAGGKTAQGGTLSVSSGRYDAPGIIPPASTVTLTVKQAGSAGTAGIGAALGNAGRFAVDSFANGGFDSLTLGGVVSFEGAIDLKARGSLRIATDGFLYADSQVKLTASAAALGMALQTPKLPGEITSPLGASPFTPSHGNGSLTVKAGVIDVGSLSLQNIGEATLAASNGDIRGNGTFQIAGDLTLRAGQIYPVTATSLSFIAYDYGTQAGSIVIRSSGGRQLPLSAVGTLGIYASVIDQQGTLRAPFGSIHLGWDGTATAPVDILAGNSQPFPITSLLTLGVRSTTSVSGVDQLTGKGVVVPYGVSTDGGNWIDPRGVDITTGGLPEKSIVLSGKNVTTLEGSSIDLRGGGDLLAYRWVSGLGGLTDVLASSDSFAIIPGYAAGFAPVSGFNNSTSEANLIGESGAGYVNHSLKVGDRIFVAGSKTLAEGYYTLLPARYALLSGAVLVCPSGGSNASGTVEKADKSSVVSGYRYNSLDDGRTVPTVSTRFELASSDVVRQRAEYETLLANTFLKNSAGTADLPVPRLPTDSGQLVFQATQAMSLLGGVASKSISAGRGSLIDISTPLETFITSSPGSVPSGAIVLDAAALNAFGAESLLIGGRRTATADGLTVTVRSGSVTVDNAGSVISAGDIILVAKDKITVSEEAEINAIGTISDSETLHLDGNGALLRVSADAGATVVRTGASDSTLPVLSIGAGTVLSGKSLTLDSTALLSLSPAARLQADAVSLRSGRVSLALINPGTLPQDSGHLLTNGLLGDLSGSDSLSLLSYSSIDIYGSGNIGSPALSRLALSAGEIRGFNTAGGTARITAGELLLGNTANVVIGGSTAVAPGTLEFKAATIHLGSNQLNVNGYVDTVLTASNGIVGEGSGGFSTGGSLTAITPVFTGAAEAKQTITAAGVLNIAAPAGTTGTSVRGGLGASISLTGSAVNIGTDIILPSGLLNVHATSGDLTVDGRLDASGTRRKFHDVTKFTSAGQIRLLAYQGSVVLNEDSLVDISANLGGGDAGVLGISIPRGAFVSNGLIRGQAGAGGIDGSFELDAASLQDLSALSDTLTAASLVESQKIRVRGGNVLIDGLARARNFSLSVDQGDIKVTGTVDASGRTGGSIELVANGDVITTNGATLTVAALDFSNSGKGGDITLAAGSQRNGVVGGGTIDLRLGSTLDLSVASKVAGDALTAGSSAYQGEFSGKLHLRAPQVSGDMRVNVLNGTIIDASSILVEGYRLYDLTTSSGAITGTMQNSIKNDATTFLGASGSITAAYTNITNRLLANNSGLASSLVLAPGAEIINRTGNLTLGTSTSTTTSDWNLSGFRFGAKGAAGVLTMRAAGDIVFFNALSDGFTPTLASTDTAWLWTARVSAYNTALPANSQSWSYHLSAGADLAAADPGETLAIDQLTGTTGSVRIGKTGTNLATGSGSTATTASAIANRFQVVRTGSGDIEINAARNVQLLNQFSNIYTAGTRVADPTMGGTFRLPSLDLQGMPSVLGSAQQSYDALYSMAGGDVKIHAGQDIERLTLTGGLLVADSQFQMPVNWLYRRGFVDSASGEFGANRWGEAASTTWWVDFSNFFQGVGALGGGDVTLTAGNNISNVDAVIPTNARMPGYSDGTQSQKLRPNAGTLLELGGGDLRVRAGNDIDAGVYYVERGGGTLSAGGSIHTNTTRSVLAQSNITAGQANVYTELPTTLFLGKGGLDVSANGDVLLGPVANPFLLPAGLLNSFWHKTYFSTYAADAYVNVSSLGGNVTLRNSATLPGQTAGTAGSLLQGWFTNKLLFTTQSASSRKPWLRLDETSVSPFSSMFTLQPGSLAATSFSSNINLVGNITLSPSARGKLDLLASGSLSAFQPNGVVTVNSTPTITWGRSSVNLSDSDPAAIPGIANPFGYQALAGTSSSAAGRTGDNLFLDFINRLFRESGGTIGENTVLQVKQALHAAGLLHRDDEEPTRIYAGSGDISGLTLFSPKFARIFAGRDIADVAFYIQNTRAGAASIITSGRDLTPYNAASPFRIAAQQVGNIVNNGSGPQAGDIQIGGPGSLQVIAGRNLDFGTGTNNADGTGTGLTSIGNTRNPYLPFEGADLVVGAGIGASTGLAASQLDIPGFVAKYVLTAEGGKYLKEIAPGVVFEDQPDDEQARLAIEVFYRILRDAGRGYGKAGNYKSAKAAIRTLFGKDFVWDGDIRTRARDIRTTNGGDISIIAPGGGLALASTTLGNVLSPPGIITASGGNISIFANNDISIGIGRIFTLRGGNEILWSNKGDIAAGSSSKTVTSAPPTRVLIDPQSAAVQTDLAGLATGGGIGVLATVKGVKPGDVDLIAPEGTVDAGDAGIRVSGNLNIAANQVLNSGNISVGGASVGTPAPVSASAGTSGLTATSNSTAATTAAANEGPQKPAGRPESLDAAETLSDITVEVIGYGGSSGSDEEEDEENSNFVE